MVDRCLYFGCWNSAGHYLVGPDGSSCGLPNAMAYDLSCKLDAQFAPKLDRDGRITFDSAPARDDWERSVRNMRLSEAPQGQFLRHELMGFTLIQWWDRNQGDKRGACNSTILLEGTHTADEVLAAGRANFPHVFKRLEDAAVELVEVRCD